MTKNGIHASARMSMVLLMPREEVGRFFPAGESHGDVKNEHGITDTP